MSNLSVLAGPADFPAEFIKCESWSGLQDQFGKPIRCVEEVEHIEYVGRWRLWCAAHTPWSGHYEDHLGDSNCSKLVTKLKVRIDQLMEKSSWVPPWVKAANEHIDRLVEQHERGIFAGQQACNCSNGCKSPTCDK